MLQLLHASTVTRCAVPIVRSAIHRPPGRQALVRVLLGAVLLTGLMPGRAARGVDAAPAEHLVVSEVVTGGAGASDELLEIHNPTSAALPLEGLEVVYVSASGATVSRRAAWEVGAPTVPAGGHLLLANEAGTFAAIADVTYAGGMAATGGSVAIRVIGASSAIDAVGWGTAAIGWPEGTPAVAPGAGSSIERLPGGAAGSWQDTEDNAADFALRDVPDPQNLASAPTPPTDPSAPTPTPQATAAPLPSPAPTAQSPDTTPIGEARGLPDGTLVTVEGVALTASDFHDGGGFVADDSGGIAVLLTDGSFARGDLVRVTGELDDRFSQRTLRADGTGVDVVGAGVQPAPVDMPTGAVGEDAEGALVHVAGSVAGNPTTLTTGLALDLDDGSGVVRVVISTSSGVDASSWTAGTGLDLVGVAGQRDSTGSGSSGYRVMPRDPADVLEVTAPPTASGSAAPSPVSGSPSPQPTAATVTTISAARAAPKNARVRVRGVITLPPGIVDPQTAVIQDATGAIVLRLGAEPPALGIGAHVEVAGVRSTKSGMETIRVTDPVARLGAVSPPTARELRSGDAGEAHEAAFVVVRGGLVQAARRSSTGSVSLDLDDGSGPLKVVLAAPLGAESAGLAAGTWVEVRGVLGQETTGAEPLAGYRVWPATLGALRVTATASDEGGGVPGSGGGSSPAPDELVPTASLDEVGTPGLSDLRIGATLVAGPWAELGVGGFLWDGTHLVAIDRVSTDLVTALLGGGVPPIALELGGLRATGSHPVVGVPVVVLGTGPGETIAVDGPIAPPRGRLSSTATWVSLVGPLSSSGERRSLEVGTRDVAVEHRCPRDEGPRRGSVSVTGVAIGEPTRLLVPCGGLRPVPILARLGGGSVAPPVAEPAGGVPTGDAHGSPGRAVAAGLMLIAALLVGGSAAFRRLQARVVAAPPIEEEPGEEDGPPRLTLVNVPREHGP